jgi:hypothetical protein
MKSKLGSALLLSTVLLFVILSMVVSLSYITVMEQKMSQKTKSSVGAFYSSESGVEWALNKIANSTNSTITGTFGALNADHSIPVPTGADYKVYLLDNDGKVITADRDISEVKAVRSVGTNYVGGAPDTTRAIEAAVAAGGNSCFTYYCGGSGSEQNCTNHGGTQLYCPTGFTQLYSMGHWGICWTNANENPVYHPPGGGCVSGWSRASVGEAYVCCQ